MTLQKTELQIPGSNYKSIAIDIIFNPDGGKCPAIIYAHGFNGFKDWGNFDLVARQFVTAGFTFIKFNFSHNGTTLEQPEIFADLGAFAENNYTKELYDLEKVIDWTSDKENGYAPYIDVESIGLIGHSMGGGISIIKTAEDNRIKALATWAAIAECTTPWTHWPGDKLQAWKENGVAYYLNGRTKQQMPMNYQLYEDFQKHPERLDIKKAVARINIPLLICHGSADTSVPVESAYRLQEANPAAALMIVDSDHVFGRKHPWTEYHLPEAMQAVTDRSINFLKENL